MTKGQRVELLELINRTQRLALETQSGSAENAEISTAMACLMRARRIELARVAAEEQEETLASE